MADTDGGVLSKTQTIFAIVVSGFMLLGTLAAVAQSYTQVGINKSDIKDNKQLITEIANNQAKLTNLTTEMATEQKSLTKEVEHIRKQMEEQRQDIKKLLIMTAAQENRRNN